tara:strand:- start:62 stop:211 length:150 start_codon:yes stop_codon:yes gene_type:complete
MRRKNRKELLCAIQERIGYMDSDVAPEKISRRFLQHLYNFLEIEASNEH